MGRLSQAPFEVRFAVLLFLALLGVADAFGAWEVRNFAAFSPSSIAASVTPQGGEHHDMSGMQDAAEKPVTLEDLDQPHHAISRDLLVQDTHVHVPAYALTAAALSLIVFALALSSQLRTLLVGLAFAAPILDFVGLWGAQLAPRFGTFFGALALAGGLVMGLVYLIVLGLSLSQCGFRRSSAGEFP